MRVLLVNQFYAPDVAATAQMAADLCEDLAAAGDHVTVIASRRQYLGGGDLPERETIRGVNVRRVSATGFGRATLAGRAADYATFYGAAALEVLHAEEPDAIVSLTTPPLVGAMCGAVAAGRAIPHVAWVQDLYPDVAEELGVLRKNGLVARSAHLVMRASLRSATAVVALGRDMAERLARRGVAEDRIHVLPNWADASAVRPISPNANPWRSAHGLDGKFVVLYSGNMGKAHDISAILGAARALRERPDVLFLFVGDGPKKGEVEAAAIELGNVRLLPYQPREALAYSLTAGDALLVSLADGLAGLIVPSKLYGAMAAGRPVLFVGPERSEAAMVVRDAACGVVTANGDARGLARAIVSLAEDRAAAEEMGRRARAELELRYDRKVVTARWRELLHQVSR